MLIEFTVMGHPAAQKRPRFFRAGDGIRSFDPDKADKYSFADMAQSYAPDEPLTVPLDIELDFYIKRPKSHYRTGKFSNELKDNAPNVCPKRPDIDNYIKFVLDSLQGLYFKDDAQVWSMYARKIYSESPRTEIKIIG